MRASRTGVINLSPPSEWLPVPLSSLRGGNSDGGGGGGDGDSSSSDKLPGRARRPRPSRGYSWYVLLGTLGRYSWCTIAVCTIRILCGPTTNGTSAPLAYHTWTKRIVRMFVSTDAILSSDLSIANRFGRRDWFTVSRTRALSNPILHLRKINLFFTCEFQREIQDYILSHSVDKTLVFNKLHFLQSFWQSLRGKKQRKSQ